ncbi:MAG: hypothetical protein QOG39_1301 [Acidimicrobiaceae bacterium]
MRAAKVTIGLLLLASTLLACSSDHRLSAADFRTKANAVCAEANARNASAPVTLPTKTVPSAQALAAYYRATLIPSIKVQLAALRKLAPPKDLAADVATALKEADAAVAKIEAAEKNPPQLYAVTSSAFSDVTLKLKKLGLTTCAGG